MLWRGGLNMSDFAAFSDEIADGMSYLEHHQILGAKWGVQNGPPYPLGSGDHSASEKKAAQAAGVKVGKDSGKGSIENVKKKRYPTRSKSPETPEEKRAAALEAVRSGDKKKIAKYMDQLSTDELRDAQSRVQAKDAITREDPSQKKASKAEMEKMEAIKSGDKEMVKAFADKMTYQELSEAMNKIDLTTRLNYTPPAPTVADKIDNAMNAIDRARGWAEKGIAAYNVMAKVYNSTHKGESQWPEIHPSNQNKEQKKEQDVIDKLVNNATKDVAKGIQQTQQEKSYKEKSDEALKNAKIDYDNEQKFNKYKKEQEAKAEAKEQKKAEKEAKKAERNKNFYEDEENTAPQVKKATFNFNKKQETEEPTEEKTRQYTPERAPQIKVSSFSNTKLSDYDDVSYDDLFSESYKEQMRNESFERAMRDYDYEDLRNSIRWSDVI